MIDFLAPVFEAFRISSPFGPRAPIKTVFGTTKDHHDGADIVTLDGSVMGDPVRGTAGGRVEFAGQIDGYGKKVVIQHADGFKSVYGHLSEILVSAGQTIAQGDIIGKIGSTGKSTGPHLHFGLMKDGKYIDPVQLIMNTAQEATASPGKNIPQAVIKDNKAIVDITGMDEKTIAWAFVVIAGLIVINGLSSMGGAEDA